MSDNYYFNAAYRIRMLHEKPPTNLSTRQLELLTILAKGNVTLNEAAVKLHISISTANQHLAACRLYFQTKTTYHAIYQAIAQGFIKVGCDDNPEKREQLN